MGIINRNETAETLQPPSHNYLALLHSRCSHRRWQRILFTSYFYEALSAFAWCWGMCSISTKSTPRGMHGEGYFGMRCQRLS